MPTAWETPATGRNIADALAAAAIRFRKARRFVITNTLTRQRYLDVCRIGMELETARPGARSSPFNLLQSPAANRRNFYTLTALCLKAPSWKFPCRDYWKVPAVVARCIFPPKAAVLIHTNSAIAPFAGKRQAVAVLPST
jgi:hypothetical protein